MAAESLLDARRLVIRGLNWIGDAVMSLPTIHNIRKALPETFLAVHAPAWSAGLYEICPAVDRVILTSEKRFFSEFKEAKKLKAEKFDAALILPNSFRSALAPALAHIPGRWGYNTDTRFPLLTNKVPRPKDADSRHTILYYMELLAAAGIEWADEKFELVLSQQTKEEAEEIIVSRGARPGSLKIGLSPGAAWGPSKRWPAERFAAAAKQLIGNLGADALIFGSGKESELIQDVVEAAGEGAVNLAEAFPQLRHLAASIAGCRLLITNDSGPMHIAASLGVPVVALFGPTDEQRSGPWGLGERAVVVKRAMDCQPCYNPLCRLQVHPCMMEIEVEEVVAVAETLLKRESASS